MDGNFLTPTALGASPIHGADFISRVLPTWADLSEARRDNIASAVRALAQKCDMPLQNVQITHAVVHRLIKAALKDCRPVSPNHRSDLQYVINRLCSQGVPPGKAPKDLSPAWQVLFDQIPSKFDQFGLCRFLQYCSRQAILPEHVTSDTLAEFELEQSKTGVLKDAGRLSRSTLAAWKHASAAVPGWPMVVLGRQKDQHVHTLPLDTYLKSFQDEVVAFQSYLSFGGLPDCGAPLVLDPYTCLANPNHDRTRKPRNKAARPATVKTRTYQIKQAAAALHHGGLGLDKLVGLADLVRPFSRAEEIANYYYDRAGQKPNSNCAGVLDLLRQIARYTGSSDEEIDKISSWLKQASPKHGGTMSAKNAGRLRQVVSKRNLAVLLHL
jgi:hypothetical protein